MPDDTTIDDGQRGLENRLGSGTEQESRSIDTTPGEPHPIANYTPAAASLPASAPSESLADVARKRWGREAETALLAQEGAKAREGWKISGVEPHFDVPSQTDPQKLTPSDVDVSATVTYQKVDKTETDPSKFNYTWSRVSSNLDELLHPEGTARQSARQPVVTRGMLDARTKQLDDETRQTLSTIVETQRAGEEDPALAKKMEQLTDAHKKHAETRIVNAQTEEDFAKAADELAKVRSINPHANDPEEDALYQRLGEKYSEKNAWKAEAAQARPHSQVAQKRDLNSRGTMQRLGSDDPVEMPPARVPTATQRAHLMKFAESVAEERAREKGWELVSTAVDIQDRSMDGDMLSSIGWDLTISASYRVMNERGLADIKTEVMHRRSEDELSM